MPFQDSGNPEIQAKFNPLSFIHLLKFIHVMIPEKIVVIGSTNMDMVIKSHHLPAAGETVLGGEFFMNQGGKGANQAITISRLGGNISFITKVGDDVFGKQSIQRFDDEGIDIFGVLSDSNTASGVAMINVDMEGENSIVVASGANASLTPSDVLNSLRHFTDARIFLMQLEIPLETVKSAAEFAAANGIRVVLNPAPANPEIKDIFHLIHILTPNTTEAEILTGIPVNDEEGARKAALLLHDMGVQNVIITMGKHGALLSTADGFHMVPAVYCKPLDTTAAGDVFNGALTLAIAEGKDLKSAVQFACRAAAISVTRLGAQSSIPNRHELILDIMPE